MFTKNEKISFILNSLGVLIILLFAIYLSVYSDTIMEDIERLKANNEGGAAIAVLFIALMYALIKFVSIGAFVFFFICAIPIIISLIKKKILSKAIKRFYIIIFSVIVISLLIILLLGNIWTSEYILNIILAIFAIIYYSVTVVFTAVSINKAKKRNLIKEDLSNKEEEN